MSIVYKKSVPDRLHLLSHSGVRSLERQASERFVWPKINPDIKQWTRNCFQYRCSEIPKSIITSPPIFSIPHPRFQHIHFDLVGSLVSYDGLTYIFTVEDCFAGRPMGCPVKEISTENIAAVSLERCAFYGYLRQRFTIQSNLSSEFTFIFHTYHLNTTACHLADNGVVERFHGKLRSPLMAQPGVTRWRKYILLNSLSKLSTI